MNSLVSMLAEIWGAISLRDLVGAGVALVGFLNWLRDRKPYAVAWTEMLDEGLFERKGWLTKDLKVEFNQQEINQPRVVIVKIDNKGQHPVRESDYAEPLRVTLRQDAKVVFAHAVSTTVNTADLCKMDANQVLLLPRLLNPDDRIFIRMLVDASNRVHPQVKGRLAGVVQIQEKGIRIRDRIDYAVLAVLAVGIMMVLYLSIPNTFGVSEAAVGGILGSMFSYFYEFIRTFRYVKENANAALVLHGLIDTFWFTSRIPRN